VGTLLIEAEREVPGRIDASTGRVAFAELADPEVDDTLDDLAELVLNAGGRVVVVPAARMPSTTGVVAIYRF
jgi:sirohydrochlorin ferrochelatase